MKNDISDKAKLRIKLDMALNIGQMTIIFKICIHMA